MYTRNYPLFLALLLSSWLPTSSTASPFRPSQLLVEGYAKAYATLIPTMIVSLVACYANMRSYSLSAEKSTPKGDLCDLPLPSLFPYASLNDHYYAVGLKRELHFYKIEVSMMRKIARKSLDVGSIREMLSLQGGGVYYLLLDTNQKGLSYLAFKETTLDKAPCSLGDIDVVGKEMLACHEALIQGGVCGKGAYIETLHGDKNGSPTQHLVWKVAGTKLSFFQKRDSAALPKYLLYGGTPPFTLTYDDHFVALVWGEDKSHQLFLRKYEPLSCNDSECELSSYHEYYFETLDQLNRSQDNKRCVHSLGSNYAVVYQEKSGNCLLLSLATMDATYVNAWDLFAPKLSCTKKGLSDPPNLSITNVLPLQGDFYLFILAFEREQKAWVVQIKSTRTKRCNLKTIEACLTHIELKSENNMDPLLAQGILIVLQDAFPTPEELFSDLHDRSLSLLKGVLPTLLPEELGWEEADRAWQVLESLIRYNRAYFEMVDALPIAGKTPYPAHELRMLGNQLVRQKKKEGNITLKQQNLPATIPNTLCRDVQKSQQVKIQRPPSYGKKAGYGPWHHTGLTRMKKWLEQRKPSWKKKDPKWPFFDCLNVAVRVAQEIGKGGYSKASEEIAALNKYRTTSSATIFELQRSLQGYIEGRTYFNTSPRLITHTDVVYRLARRFHFNNYVISAAFVADPSQVMVVSASGILHLCRNSFYMFHELVGTIRSIRIDDTVYLALFAEDGSKVISASHHHGTTSVKLWRLKDGPTRITSLEDKSFIYWLDFSADGLKIVTGSYHRGTTTLKLWNRETLIGTHLLDSWILSTKFNSDGSQLMIVTNYGLFKIAHRRAFIMNSMKYDVPINLASFSQDGSQLVTISRKKIQIWDIMKEALMTTLCHEGFLQLPKFSPNGSQLMIISGKEIQIWNVMQGTLMRRLLHDDRVQSGNFSPDSSQVVTASHKTVSVWDLGKGALISTLQHECRVASVAWNADGSKLLITGTRSPTIALWGLYRPLRLYPKSEEAKSKLITQVHIGKERRPYFIGYCNDLLLLRDRLIMKELIDPSDPSNIMLDLLLKHGLFVREWMDLQDPSMRVRYGYELISSRAWSSLEKYAILQYIKQEALEEDLSDELFKRSIDDFPFEIEKIIISLYAASHFGDLDLRPCGNRWKDTWGKQGNLDDFLAPHRKMWIMLAPDEKG